MTGLTGRWKHVTTHDQVVVEEEGPVRIVLAVHGSPKPGDTDGKLYRYTARMCLTADNPSVRTIFTLARDHLKTWAY